MANCPYCKHDEFSIEELNISEGPDTCKTEGTLTVLVCKKCSSLLSVLKTDFKNLKQNIKPLPPTAYKMKGGFSKS